MQVLGETRLRYSRYKDESVICDFAVKFQHTIIPIVAVDFSALLDYYRTVLSQLGGETASTGIKKLRLHIKILPACKNGGELNIIADDYNYALAA